MVRRGASMAEQNTGHLADVIQIPECERCLGPLAFQSCPGSRLLIRADGQYVERQKDTNLNALAFSSRPMRTRERIRIRVERCDQHWEGALRVGFTARPPSSFSPVPNLVVPGPGVPPDSLDHWARALPTAHSWPGAELSFWVNSRGVFKYKGPDGVKLKLFDGVHIGKPLWALVEVYGQTRAVRLLGSTMKKCFFREWTSCPMPPPPAPSEGDSCMCIDWGQRCHMPVQPSATFTEIQPPNSFGSAPEEMCTVCVAEAVSVTLLCGHRCLCSSCADRIIAEFGTCPLCRHHV